MRLCCDQSPSPAPHSFSPVSMSRATTRRELVVEVSGSQRAAECPGTLQGCRPCPSDTQRGGKLRQKFGCYHGNQKVHENAKEPPEQARRGVIWELILSLLQVLWPSLLFALSPSELPRDPKPQPQQSTVPFAPDTGTFSSQKGRGTPSWCRGNELTVVVIL